MLFVDGRMPGLPRNARGPEIRRAALLLLAGLLAAGGVCAHSMIPLTLAEAEDIALAGEPGREGMLARAAALEDEAAAATALPDPTLRMGLLNYPIEAGDFSTEGMTQVALGVRQAFPPGDTLELEGRRYASMAREMQRAADGRGRDVLSSVRQAWLETYYWQEAHEIVLASRPLFADLVTVTRSLYSVGRRDQQDLLRAELELRRIDDRLIEFNRRHMQAIATLSEWIGEDARRPMAEALPPQHAPPPLEILALELPEHPAIQAAEARVDARDAGVDLAEERFKPGWALDLGYGYRDGRLPNGDSRSDFVSLQVTVDLPWFRRGRNDSRLSAALSERRAAEASQQELERRLRSRLESEYARWTDLDRRIDLYDEQILALAQSTARASLTAYQSDTADFAEVMRAYIDDLNTRVDYIRLQVEREQSYAALANLGGLPR